MPDYSKGKIYKLTSENYNKIYIGSTCRTLKERFYEHKRQMRSYIKQNKSCQYCSSYELCEEPDCKIELIKKYSCNSRKELCREEGKYQLLNKNIIVNDYIAGQTHKEWKKTEKGKASNKRYKNSEKGKASNKRYYNSEKGKASKKRRAKKYNQSEKGKATRRKRQNKRTKCSICNKEINQSSLRRHIKTQHQ